MSHTEAVLNINVPNTGADFPGRLYTVKNVHRNYGKKTPKSNSKIQ